MTVYRKQLPVSLYTIPPDTPEDEILALHVTLTYELRKEFYIACLRHDFRASEAVRLLAHVFVNHPQAVLSLAAQLTPPPG